MWTGEASTASKGRRVFARWGVFACNLDDELHPATLAMAADVTDEVIRPRIVEDEGLRQTATSGSHKLACTRAWKVATRDHASIQSKYRVTLLTVQVSALQKERSPCLPKLFALQLSNAA
eukprot:scaffold6873_cov161-Prasinococcus_capsulatus_cf.AAC.1